MPRRAIEPVQLRRKDPPVAATASLRKHIGMCVNIARQKLRSSLWTRRAVLPLPKARVLALKVKDHADAGQVETGVEQLDDSAQAIQVVRAVPAGTTVRAIWA